MDSNSVHKIDHQSLRNWTQIKNQYLEEIFFLKNEEDQIKIIKEFIEKCKAGITKHKCGNRGKMDLLLSYNDFLCFPIVNELVVAKQLSVSLDINLLKALEQKPEKFQNTSSHKFYEDSPQKGGIRRQNAFLSESEIYPDAIDILSKA